MLGRNSGNTGYAWVNPSTLGGLTVGTTAIASGTTTRVLFDNAGVVDEYVITGTGNVVMSASPTLTGTIIAAAATWSGLNTFAVTARSSGVASYLVVTSPADTGQTASTESIGINLNSSATRTWAAGALTTQREVLIQGPTYAFAGASTLTTAVTLEVSGPKAGTNATITNKYALRAVAGSDDGVALAAKPNSVSATANIVEFQRSDGLACAYLDNSNNHWQMRFGCESGSYADWGNSLAYINFNSNGGDGVFHNRNTGNIGWVFVGLVSRTQSILQLQTSAGASLGNVGGVIFDHFATVSTTHTDGTFDTIYSDTTVANTLAINGDKITFDYVLTLVTHTTNTAQIKLAFGGIGIFDSGAITIAATAGARLTGYIIRVTSTTCRAVVTLELFGSATLVGGSVQTYTSDGTLTGMTLTGTNILLLTAASAGTGAASGDISGVMGTIACMPSGA